MSLVKFDLNRLFVFCENVSGPHFCVLQVPFVQDGYLYATDGRIAARVPTDAANTVIPGLKFPNAAGVFSCVEKVSPMYMPASFAYEHGVLVEGALIAERYWFEIKGLPRVRLVTMIYPDKPIGFVFDYEGQGDGEVVVMPLCRQDD